MKVTIYPDEALRRKAAVIDEINDEVCQNAEEMFDIMREAEGVGLAGPQVGWSRRLIVVGVEDELPDGERALINPVITDEYGTLLSEEGCLSFPGITGNVVRSEVVDVSAYNLNGEKVEIKATGLLARVFQHEIDHLNGVLFIDRMTPASRMSVTQKVKELERLYQKVRAS